MCTCVNLAWESGNIFKHFHFLGRYVLADPASNGSLDFKSWDQRM